MQAFRAVPDARAADWPGTFDYSQVGPLHARALELLGYPQRNAAGIEATLRKLQARYPGS